MIAEYVFYGMLLGMATVAPALAYAYWRLR